MKIWAIAVFVSLLSWSGAAFAQAVATLNDSPLVVRLCPLECKAVRSHDLRPGGQVQLYENNQGWVRVSPFYTRAQVRARFGFGLPPRPALWIPINNLAIPTEEEIAQQVAEAPRPRVDVVTRVANLRTIPLPKFRTNAGQDQPAVANAEAEAAAETKRQDAIAAEKERAAVAAEAERLAKAEAQAARDAQAKAEAERVAAEQAEALKREAADRAAAQAEAQAQEQAQAEAAAEAQANAEAEKVAAEKAAAEAKAAAAEAKIAAARKAEIEQAKAELEEAEKAVALAESSNAEFTSATPTPLVLGTRPSSLTKALLDERLSALPRKVTRRDTKEIVIALRHYAKALLDSRTCTGIAEGGRAAQPGMLFIKCTDDPFYPRVFPLQEVSW